MASQLDYDKHGYCIICSKQVVIDEVYNGSIQKRFTPEYAETELLLNDGSKMRVCTCVSCKQSFDSEKYALVMSKVYKGWEHELKTLNWTEDKKQSYLKKYSEIEIVTKPDGKPNAILEIEHSEFPSKKVKENKK